MKKRDILSRFLVSFLCGSALAIGNLFCLITAFDITVDVDLLIKLCLSASILCSLAYSFKRALPGVSLFVCLVVGLMIWKWDAVSNGYILTAKTLMEQYIAAYDELSGLALVAVVPEGTTATLFLATVGAGLVLITTSVISKRKGLWVLAACSILLLSLCLLIPQSMPDVWAFTLLLGTYILLVITQSRRRNSTDGQYLLALGMVLPVALFVLCIVSIVQPATYVRSDVMLDLRDELKAIVENNSIIIRDDVTGEFGFVSPFVHDTLGVVSWNEDVSETDLSRIGPQSQNGTSVMSVYSEKDEEYYLRGNALAIYEDNSWLALDEDVYSDVPITEGVWLTDVKAQDEIQIRTDRRSSIFYLPYRPTNLPENAEIYYDSYVSNTENVIDYTVGLTENAPIAEISPEYDAFVHEVYTQVPDETRAALGDIVDEIEEKAWLASNSTAIDVVVEYVESSAIYDLNTPQMPAGEDFVRWFLEDSDTGYCVHFASAATILLRCMDIPARYVSGYLVYTNGGEWTTVTQDDAHAWVEYYIDGYGWKRIEPTPAGAISDEGETEQTTPAETEEPSGVELEQSVTENAEGENAGTVADDTGEAQFHIPSFVWIVLAVAVVVVLWRPVIRKLRSEILKRGTSNERAIKYYHRIELLSKLAEEPVMEELEALVLKARFSQHRISGDELAVLSDAFNELCSKLLGKRDPMSYLLYHFVFALPKT